MSAAALHTESQTGSFQTGSPTHHIPPELLLDYAAGSLGEPWALVVACHLAYCPACRQAMGEIEAMGGSLLDSIPPADLDPALLSRTLGQLGAIQLGASPARPEAPRPMQPPVDGILIPKPLQAYIGGDLNRLDWRWNGTGVHSHALPLAKAKGGMVSLLRIDAARALPMHTHRGEELTLVLAGGFTDAMGSFRRGDVAVADDAIEHQPVAMAEGPCICLAVTDAPLRFKGPFGWILNQWARLSS